MESPFKPLLELPELDAVQVEIAAAALLDQSVSDDDKAVFLSHLARRGETPAELAAFVTSFLGRAVAVELDPAEAGGPVIDVCGTGGDCLNLFNVSTTGVFVLAGAGARVVKHGNRGMTSKSGGADVLEALGIRIDLSPDRVVECVKSVGAGFLFAPVYHPSFKTVAPVRKRLAETGQRTLFNLLGPLLNPSRPEVQLVGVFSGHLSTVYAEILGRLGRKRAWVVHGHTGDGRGMDEMSTLGLTEVHDLENGEIVHYELTPDSLGLQTASLDDLKGGDAKENATILRNILSGVDQGPRRELVLLNVAGALVVSGLAVDLKSGWEMGGEIIDSGRAMKVLDAWQSFSKA